MMIKRVAGTTNQGPPPLILQHVRTNLSRSANCKYISNRENSFEKDTCKLNLESRANANSCSINSYRMFGTGHLISDFNFSLLLSCRSQSRKLWHVWQVALGSTGHNIGNILKTIHNLIIPPLNVSLLIFCICILILCCPHFKLLSWVSLDSDYVDLNYVFFQVHFLKTSPQPCNSTPLRTQFIEGWPTYYLC